MSGSDPLLQVHRIIKELRIALVLSHHDGNTALTDHRNLLHYFLFKTSDLGNTPFRFDPICKPAAAVLRLYQFSLTNVKCPDPFPLGFSPTSILLSSHFLSPSCWLSGSQ